MRIGTAKNGNEIHLQTSQEGVGFWLCQIEPDSGDMIPMNWFYISLAESSYSVGKSQFNLTIDFDLLVVRLLLTLGLNFGGRKNG